MTVCGRRTKAHHTLCDWKIMITSQFPAVKEGDAEFWMTSSRVPCSPAGLSDTRLLQKQRAVRDFGVQVAASPGRSKSGPWDRLHFTVGLSWGGDAMFKIEIEKNGVSMGEVLISAWPRVTTVKSLQTFSRYWAQRLLNRQRLKNT